VINGLVDAPCTRRVQIGIWKPWEDAGIDDPACLQRMWFRIFNFDGKTGDLVMSTYMRSNDAFKAAWMNMYAFLEIGFYVARRVSKILGADIKFVQYIHSADSYHIYGSYFNEFESFLELSYSRDFEDRTWSREKARPYVVDAREQVLDKLKSELSNLNGETARDLAKRIDRVRQRYCNDSYYPMRVG
jgi:thymidylate synthase